MKPLVWYIHGAWSTPLSFNWFKHQLRDHDAVEISYSHDTPTMDTVRELRRQAVLEDRPINIVGHSLGGVIAAGIAQVAPVRKIVTMGSPFGGNSVASVLRWFSASQLISDMNPLSDILRGLRTNPPSTPMLSFVTDPGVSLFGEQNDGVVAITSQRALQGPAYVTVKLNHFEILLSPDVAKQVDSFLLGTHL